VRRPIFRTFSRPALISVYVEVRPIS
jgi:hypothetical protein